MLCLVHLLLLAMLIMIYGLVFRAVRRTGFCHRICHHQALPWREYECRHEQKIQQVFVPCRVHIA
jgi:hypothetical protein